jgi:hypothetical protein
MLYEQLTMNDIIINSEEGDFIKIEPRPFEQMTVNA